MKYNKANQVVYKYVITLIYYTSGKKDKVLGFDIFLLIYPKSYKQKFKNKIIDQIENSHPIQSHQRNEYEKVEQNKPLYLRPLECLVTESAGKLHKLHSDKNLKE